MCVCRVDAGAVSGLCAATGLAQLGCPPTCQHSSAYALRPHNQCDSARAHCCTTLAAHDACCGAAGCAAAVLSSPACTAHTCRPQPSASHPWCAICGWSKPSACTNCGGSPPQAGLWPPEMPPRAPPMPPPRQGPARMRSRWKRRLERIRGRKTELSSAGALKHGRAAGCLSNCDDTAELRLSTRPSGSNQHSGCHDWSRLPMPSTAPRTPRAGTQQCPKLIPTACLDFKQRKDVLGSRHRWCMLWVQGGYQTGS